MKVPRAAANTFKQLASFLCSNQQEGADDGWVVSTPLPSAVRPGRLLKAARLRAEMTQQKLAQEINVPQAHISQYERNERKIPYPKAIALAKILKTSSEYFVN
ncbi:helix-turn-helix transcriptional regulator [uncultured Desulfovibrio sp.]|uniref:helix-turn-helix domain-containing protein n=1 Tax=uncultured Desulfovibrio sp. TaxID=167968 RepID=UPI0025F496ED|nr:helix-turn-helix transcriptional regulator [uncultured Desulfovibrio sp.]